ncbi:acetylornithine deacetylase [Pseudomonas oryzihabitans]|uniref:Acetylornithine deacetylase n=1 Tax=Pseudomonas flavocrustae TaxID=2991719 RepID=A0ABT6IER2_9PSED|nr:acetylornithine deacetylase [Pseudomonas sp. CBMAI 2609]MDH4762906.1 acetylornithine deacetylase [Pseudomonas sp. CBMAI 2609]
MNSQDLLRTLIGFPTVSADSNLALIQHVQGLLEGAGIACRLVLDESGCKANLFASVGPGDVPGVLLSGHTDVVPVAGQAWTLPPFAGTFKEGRIHGRGACDMKGFVACAVVALLDAARGEPLKRPLQLALSHDEEIGCVGVRRLLDVLEMAPVRPFLCIVGEPTNMQVALGHKGKAALRAHCHGQEGHSSLAPRHVNAIHLASDLVGALRASQRRLAEEGAHDAAYDIPYTTLHVGRIDGGKALNIVPNLCTLDFEIRHLPADDPASLVAALQETADSLVREAQQTSAKAAIEIETVNAYPGLDTHPSVEAVRFLQTLVEPGTAQLKVAFGTEGGLFANRLDTPVVVCGPGSIEQAHKPDEYVEISQLEACDALLGRLRVALG